MVKRIFRGLNKRPRMVSIPLWAFRIAVAVARLLPRFRKWSPAMAERMNLDMAFDHEEAAQDLKFLPQKFNLDQEDKKD